MLRQYTEKEAKESVGQRYSEGNFWPVLSGRLCVASVDVFC